MDMPDDQHPSMTWRGCLWGSNLNGLLQIPQSPRRPIRQENHHRTLSGCTVREVFGERLEGGVPSKQVLQETDSRFETNGTVCWKAYVATYQLFAISAMILPRASTSRTSTTSAGACE